MGDLVTLIFVKELRGPCFVPLLPRGRWLLGSPSPKAPGLGAGLLSSRNVQSPVPAANTRVIMQHHLFPMASDYAISEQKNAKPWKNTVAF